MFEILIIEDCADDASILNSYIMRFAHEHQQEMHVEWVQSAKQIKKVHSKKHIDLIFLDICLDGEPDGSGKAHTSRELDGLEAASLLRTYDQTTPIIFVTSLANYALSGYEVGALGFLVKPYSYQTFCLHMKRALSYMKHEQNSSLAINVGTGMRIISHHEISYIETDGHYLIFHTDEEDIRTRTSLASIEERLASGSFVRISSYYLVNIERIKRISGNKFELDTGAEVFASRAKKKQVLQKVSEYWGGSI